MRRATSRGEGADIAPIVAAGARQRGRRFGSALSRPGSAADPAVPCRVAIIVNPSRPGARQAQDLLSAEIARLGWAAPIVLPTSVAEPGAPQARMALDRGADRVVVVGGDGTLRQVAHELVGRGVPVAVVPVGTANLFARNLLLAPRPPAESVRIALQGDLARVDTGLATMTTRHGMVRGTFLVLAGIGHDALTVQRVPETLKRRVGWLGYLGPAASTVLHRPIRMRIRLDDRESAGIEAWSVLAVNCGRIPGGLRITHGSFADDGVLEALVVTASTPRHWAGIMAKGVLDLPHEVPGLQQDAVRRLRVRPAHAQPVQLDGDVVHGVGAIDIEVRPGALSVVVPPSRPDASPGRPPQNSPVAGSRSVTQ